MAIAINRVVGAAFLEGRGRWPEMSSLRLRSDHAEILLFVASPDAATVHAAAHGQIQWGWAGTSQGAHLRVGLTGQQHHRITYHVHHDIHDGLGPQLDNFPVDTELPTAVTLIDAATGRIMAASQHQWPTEVAMVVLTDLRRQDSAPSSSSPPMVAFASLVDSYGGGAVGADLMLADHGIFWETSPSA